MRVIRRGDVIGRRLSSIYAASECEDGLDVCDCVLVLDSGLVFRLPSFPDEPFLPAEIPPGSKPVHDPRLRDVCGATITRLLRPRQDDDFFPGATILGLSTGRWIRHEMAAPAGLGAAGINILEAESIDLGGYMDFWHGDGKERSAG